MKKAIRLALFLTLISALLLFIFIGITNKSLTFDEAGQFWVSKGLNHFSPMNVSYGNVKDVWIQNRTWNLDPGGFSVIAYYWLQLSNSIVWIRLLPLLFSILTLIFLRKLLLLLSMKKETATILVLLFFLSNSLTIYSFVFRAYSFEIFGVILTLFYVLKFQRDIFQYRHLLFLGIISGIFLFSRYGFALHIIAFSIILIFLMKLQKKLNFKTLFKFTFFYSFPIIIAVLFIYFQQYLFHIKSDPVPMYQRQFTLMHNSFIKLFVLNFLSFRGIPFFVVLVLVIFNFLWLKIELSKTFYLLFLWMILIHLVSILFSIYGLYPWYIKGRWGLTLELISLISFLFLLHFIDSKISGSNLLFNHYKIELLSIILVGILLFRVYSPDEPCRILLDKLKNSTAQNAIINWFLTPAAKYHLKHNKEYDGLYQSKNMKFEGIDSIAPFPKKNTWILVNNPDALVKQARFSAIKYPYDFIINEPLYQILIVK